MARNIRAALRTVGVGPAAPEVVELRVDAFARAHERQGLTLVHLPTQRKHVLWDTLCLWEGSMTRNGSG